MPAEKTQPFCPCSGVLNWTGTGLRMQLNLYFCIKNSQTGQNSDRYFGIKSFRLFHYHCTFWTKCNWSDKSNMVPERLYFTNGDKIVFTNIKEQLKLTVYRAMYFYF